MLRPQTIRPKESKFYDRLGGVLGAVVVVALLWIIPVAWYFKGPALAAIAVAARSCLIYVITSDRPIDNWELARRSVLSFLIGLVSVVVAVAVILA